MTAPAPFQTALCRRLGIDYPVFQAAIGGAASPELAAAVSNAGGFGTVTMTGWGTEGVQERLRAVRAQTNKSYAANLILALEHEAELAELLDDPPPVLSLFWGDAAAIVPKAHVAGSLVMLTVGSIDEARKAADDGVDIIVAQGWEAGGHVRGTLATLPFVAAVVPAVDPVPVIAAGGISDGRGLAAVLALGAQGAWMGTRFLSAQECHAHPDYQARVLTASASETMYGALFDGGWPGAPGRVLRNSTVEVWEAAGCPPSGSRPGEGETVAADGDGRPYHRYDANVMRRDHTGDVEAASLWSGQGVDLVTKIEPASTLVHDLVRDARAAMRGMPA